ncbi:MAG: ATP-binding protein [Thermodesulfobacteriota bacterium]
MKPIHVLLVDDEEEFAQILAERLNARGFFTRLAYDGAQALAEVRESPVDVVVLDINLPGKSGLEVLKEIKEARPLAQVILLTGLSNIQTAIKGMKSGASDYLVKPVEIEVLADNIKAAQGHKISQEENLRMLETTKLATLGVLAEGVAHEINNPAGIMIQEAGWLEDLLDDLTAEGSEGLGPRLDEFRKSLTRIKAQGRRIKEITSKLLKFSGRMDPRPREVDLKPLIGGLLEGLRPRLEESRVELMTDFSENLPRLYLSPTEMEQVIQNLVDNALEALPEQGGVLKLAARETGGLIQIEVSDNGRGIPRADLPRIFEPFFSTKQVGQGTGLGLAVAYSLVKNMGGLITVESEEGRGTTLTITLPLKTFVEEAGTAGRERSDRLSGR